jgi:hypothetical protein
MTRIGRLFIAPTSLIVFGVSFAVLEPPAAQADCAHWDIGGHWEIQQGNGIAVTMDLTQTGTDVRGSGHFTTAGSSAPFGQFGASVDGSITGTIDNNNNILLNATWGGVYRGGVGSDAFIGGDTFATNDPGNQVGWRGNRTATCQVAEAEPSATTPESHAPEPQTGEIVEHLLKGKHGHALPPAPAPAGQTPTAKVATANDDVDIYKGPGGQFGAYVCGQLNCFMNKDETAPVLDFQDNWYKVQTNKVPDGAGWVAADHVTVSP